MEAMKGSITHKIVPLTLPFCQLTNQIYTWHFSLGGVSVKEQLNNAIKKQISQLTFFLNNRVEAINLLGENISPKGFVDLEVQETLEQINTCYNNVLLHSTTTLVNYYYVLFFINLSLDESDYEIIINSIQYAEMTTKSILKYYPGEDINSITKLKKQKLGALGISEEEINETFEDPNFAWPFLCSEAIITHITKCVKSKKSKKSKKGKKDRIIEPYCLKHSEQESSTSCNIAPIVLHPFIQSYFHYFNEFIAVGHLDNGLDFLIYNDLNNLIKHNIWVDTTIITDKINTKMFYHIVYILKKEHSKFLKNTSIIKRLNEASFECCQDYVEKGGLYEGKDRLFQIKKDNNIRNSSTDKIYFLVGGVLMIKTKECLYIESQDSLLKMIGDKVRHISRVLNIKFDN